jgi:hypothetical protein
VYEIEDPPSSKFLVNSEVNPQCPFRTQVELVVVVFRWLTKISDASKHGDGIVRYKNSDLVWWMHGIRKLVLEPVRKWDCPFNLELQDELELAEKRVERWKIPDNPDDYDDETARALSELDLLRQFSIYC